jgi:DNA-binding MarR family transcriptional regulator
LPDRSAQPAVPGDVAAALGASLSLLYRRLRQGSSEGELTLPERSALSRLGRGGPMTATALARQEQISPQSIGATLATLEQRGLVERQPDPDDGRRITLSLTATGLAAVQAKRAARDAQLTQALESDFTPEERAQLLAITPLLERLAERL